MPRPNFLIIMTDEHNPQISSPHGHPFIHTPALQRLADGGAVFENGYCNSPLCVPSRASFMTGKHLHRIGVWDNSVPLATDEPTWAHRLNAAGYETCLSGKMHFIGPDQNHGFRRRIMPDIHGMGEISANLPDWTTGMPPETRRGNLRKRLTQEPGAGDHPHMDYDEEVAASCLAYLSEPARNEKPWALCASIFTPHFPFKVRGEYYYKYYPEHADLPDIPGGHLESQHQQHQDLRRYFECDDIPEEQVRKARAAYYGLVEFADVQIGKILDALERNGLAENTIVAYTADHGEMLGEHGLWYKCSFYEQSVRVPFMIRWPGVVEPGSRYGQVTSLLDLTATVLDVAGDDGGYLDGASLAPLLRGETKETEGVAIAEYEGHGTVRPARMVRRGSSKLNYYGGAKPELYDLESDPREMNDLAADAAYADTVAELTEIALDEWDPDEIRSRVLSSQETRRLVAAGTEGSWAGPWRSGKYG